jgi:hypothetical protein
MAAFGAQAVYCNAKKKPAEAGSNSQFAEYDYVLPFF